MYHGTVKVAVGHIATRFNIILPSVNSIIKLHNQPIDHCAQCTVIIFNFAMTSESIMLITCYHVSSELPSGSIRFSLALNVKLFSFSAGLNRSQCYISFLLIAIISTINSVCNQHFSFCVLN